MSKRQTNLEKLLTKLNHLSESEIGELLNYLSTLEKGRHNPEPSEDELLMMLSSARENRRARQVFEWESARRRAEAKASTQRFAQR
jgi:hypothetical protein